MSFLEKIEWCEEKQLLIQLVQRILKSETSVSVCILAQETEKFLHNLRNKISLTSDLARHTPVILILMIFSFLPLEEIYVGRRICKSWFKTLDSKNLKKMNLIFFQLRQTIFIPTGTCGIASSENGVYCVSPISLDQTRNFGFESDILHFKPTHDKFFHYLRAFSSLGREAVQLLAYSQGLLYLYWRESTGHFVVSVNTNEGFRFIDKYVVRKPVKKIFVCPNRKLLLSIQGSTRSKYWCRCWLHDLKKDPTTFAIWKSNLFKYPYDIAVGPPEINRFFLITEGTAKIEIRSLTSGKFISSSSLERPLLALEISGNYLFACSWFGIHILNFEGRQLGRLRLFSGLGRVSSRDKPSFLTKKMTISTCQNILYLHYETSLLRVEFT